MTGNDKNCTPNSVCMFRVQNHIIRFSSFPALVLSGPGKVVKIRMKYFSIVLTGNDKNCTPNIVGMFRLQNRVIRAWFSNLPALGQFRWFPDPKNSSKFDRSILQWYWQETIRTTPQTVWECFGSKIWPKYFFAVLMLTKKHCTPNNVGIFRVQNRVIRARFSTLPLLSLFRWCSDPESHQNLTEIFQPYYQETIRTAPETLWVCFECKTKSFMPGIQLFQLRCFLVPEKSSKVFRNIFFCRTNGKR